MSSDSPVLVYAPWADRQGIPADRSDQGLRHVAARQLRSIARSTKVARDPWTALDVGSDIPQRLIEGWGNASWSTDDEYLIARSTNSADPGPILGMRLRAVDPRARNHRAAEWAGRVWTLENHALWGERVARRLTAAASPACVFA
jgi:hypothetical protein